MRQTQEDAFKVGCRKIDPETWPFYQNFLIRSSNIPIHHLQRIDFYSVSATDLLEHFFQQKRVEYSSGYLSTTFQKSCYLVRDLFLPDKQWGLPFCTFMSSPKNFASC